LVTGHSLGGALATIAAVHLSYAGCLNKYPGRIEPLWAGLGNGDEYIACKGALDPSTTPEGSDSSAYRTINALYTFGAPRAGDSIFARLAMKLGWSDRHVYRFVNKLDVITQVPVMGFFHPGEGWPFVNEGASFVGVSDGVHRGHPIAGYEAAILTRVKPGLEVPDPPDEQSARVKRYEQAVREEGTPLAPLDPAYLGGRARLHFDALSSQELAPEAFTLNVDGEMIYGIKVHIEEPGRTLDDLLLFDSSFAFVVTLETLAPNIESTSTEEPELDVAPTP
jgi:hypothetical protein